MNVVLFFVAYPKAAVVEEPIKRRLYEVPQAQVVLRLLRDGLGAGRRRKDHARSFGEETIPRSSED